MKQTELEMLREHHRKSEQDKFNKLIIEREDAELRKQFCVSGELLLHPSDRQCKDNPNLVVYGQIGNYKEPFPRALMMPPEPNIADYSKVNWAKAATDGMGVGATEDYLLMDNAYKRSVIEALEKKVKDLESIPFRPTRTYYQQISKTDKGRAKTCSSTDIKKKKAEDIISSLLRKGSIDFSDAVNICIAL